MASILSEFDEVGYKEMIREEAYEEAYEEGEISGMIKLAQNLKLPKSQKMCIRDSSNQQNRESTQAVSGNFNHIMEGTDTVVAQAQELMGIVDDLFSANREITENIQKMCIRDRCKILLIIILPPCLSLLH